MDKLQIQNCLEPIAIIGMAGRFPGAKNIDEYWHNLCKGVESISFFTDEELAAASIDRDRLYHPNYVKANSVLEDIEMFDASFFGYTPREAEGIDPQHRMFLECAWEALESSGYHSEAYKGRISVYAGTGMSTYLLNNLFTNENIDISDPKILFNNDKDYLTTRISYKLNLKGPSVSIGTACSTSLVAVHLACQDLLSGRCDMALAGSVTIEVPQNEGYFYQEGSITSPDGHCRAFDAKAKGTIFGNGIGLVVLKRLEDALVDGDSIHAVIKGTAINNDGSLKVSYTAPSIDGQAEVIAEAQTLAGVSPDTITYIEAHGTGTALGDPIEITALSKVFRAQTSKKGFCAVGSVKTNIGHLKGTAGIAGLIKTVLALKHRQIPPTLHFEEPNPKIDFANSPFFINSTLHQWDANGNPRRAGVSSFGFGGTNAHVILEEAPNKETVEKSRPWQVLILSAKTSSALDTATTNIVQHLQQNPDLNLSDVGYTLQVGRKAFQYRRMLVCKNLNDAVDALQSQNLQRVFTNIQESRVRPVAFMFSGQGTQYVNMGLELYQTELTFRNQVDICAEILKYHLDIDLRQLLYPSDELAEETAQKLKQTAIAQPALFVIEYALAKLWIEWGIHPQAMIGHSSGELVAACLAGVFSLEDALFLVSARGRLMQQLPEGAMLAVPLAENDIQPLLDKEISLAAINGSSLCVVSGLTKDIEALQNQLGSQGIQCSRLHTSHAFHSQMVEPILKPFAEQVQKVSLNTPKIPYVSNVTGTWITDSQATDPQYWVEHLRQTVRFASGIGELLAEPERVLLEIGPGQTLSTIARQHPDKSDHQAVLSSLPQMQDGKSDAAFLLNTLGKLWLAGIEINWPEFYTHEERLRLPLPTYPFERQRYWIDHSKRINNIRPSQMPLRKIPDIADWFYFPSWKRSIGLVRKSVRKTEPSCWLMFIDDCNLGSQLAKQLQIEGHEVITVRVGLKFAKLSDQSYTINPEQEEGYSDLISELMTLKKTPKEIVHLWSVTKDKYTVSPFESFAKRAEFFEKTQNLGFYSLLFLAQALVKYNFINEINLTVISSDMQKVTENDATCPDKATVLGPVRVFPQELPNIRCRSIDVVLSESQTGHNEQLVDQIIAELVAQSSDLVIAFRGEHRWLQTFEKVKLDGTVNQGKPRLRKGGVYLITGGIGGIGTTMAQYLAKTVQAKLVLTGLTAFPQPEQWDKWLLENDENDHVSQGIKKVRNLELLGAEVMIAQCDAGNLEQSRELLAQIEKRFGEINGVIHAAGIFETQKAFRGIEETSRTDCERRFLPKVYGTLVLEELLRGKDLDFCLMQSSLSSMLGGLGFVAYSAGNLFMDTFADVHKNNSRIPWMSVNWDGWIFREPDEKITKNSVISASFASPSFGVVAEIAITPQEGANALARILSWGEVHQLLVSTANLQQRIDQWINFDHLKESNTSKKIRSLHPRQGLTNPYVAATNETEQILADIFQRILGIEKVGIYDNYFELGGDSLLGIQIVSQVSSTFEVVPSVITMFENPTVAGLSEHIQTLRWLKQEPPSRSHDEEDNYEKGKI